MQRAYRRACGGRLRGYARGLPICPADGRLGEIRRQLVKPLDEMIRLFGGDLSRGAVYLRQPVHWQRDSGVKRLRLKPLLAERRPIPQQTIGVVKPVGVEPTHLRA